MSDEKTPYPHELCSIHHEKINLQLQTLEQLTRKHHHVIFGSDTTQGLLTKFGIMQNSLENLLSQTQELTAKKEKNALNIITLLAAILSPLISFALIKAFGQ